MYNTDIISKLRRSNKIQETAQQYNIILNDDGSVFDRTNKKQYSSLVEWSRELS